MTQPVKFLLHANQFSERGDSVTLMTIARGLKEELGIDSLIAFPSQAAGNSSLRFEEAVKSGYSIFSYDSRAELESRIRSENITHNYVVSDGSLGGVAYSRDDVTKFRLLETRHCTQAVFRRFEPHGDVYAYISSWLFDWSKGRLNRWASSALHPSLIARLAPRDRQPEISWVPHIVRPEYGNGQAFREKFGVPRSAKLVGRIGGRDQFSDIAAQRGLLRVLEANPDVYAIMVNTQVFGNHPRLIYCETLSRSEVWDFYAAGDVFVNGRKMGESFGFSIVEPLSLGKPVIAPSMLRNLRMDKHHITLLKQFGLLYWNSESFKALVEKALANPPASSGLLAAAANFQQDRVMRRFAEVFIEK
jgi:hypothetical protein